MTSGSLDGHSTMAQVPHRMPRHKNSNFEFSSWKLVHILNRTCWVQLWHRDHSTGTLRWHMAQVPHRVPRHKNSNFEFSSWKLVHILNRTCWVQLWHRDHLTGTLRWHMHIGCHGTKIKLWFLMLKPGAYTKSNMLSSNMTLWLLYGRSTLKLGIHVVGEHDGSIQRWN